MAKRSNPFFMDAFHAGETFAKDRASTRTPRYASFAEWWKAKGSKDAGARFFDAEDAKDFWIKGMNANKKKNPSDYTLGWWYSQGHVRGKQDSNATGVDPVQSAKGSFSFMWKTVEQHWGGKAEQKDSAWSAFDRGYAAGYSGRPKAPKMANDKRMKLSFTPGKAPNPSLPTNASAQQIAAKLKQLSSLKALLESKPDRKSHIKAERIAQQMKALAKKHSSGLKANPLPAKVNPSFAAGLKPGDAVLVDGQPGRVSRIDKSLSSTNVPMRTLYVAMGQGGGGPIVAIGEYTRKEVQLVKKNPRLFSKAAGTRLHRYTVQGGPSTATRVTDSLAAAKKLVAAMVKAKPHEWVTVYDTKTNTFPIEYRGPGSKMNPSLRGLKAKVSSIAKRIGSKLKKLTPSGRRSTTALKRLQEASKGDPLGKTKRMILAAKKASRNPNDVQHYVVFIGDKLRSKHSSKQAAEAAASRLRKIEGRGKVFVYTNHFVQKGSDYGYQKGVLKKINPKRKRNSAATSSALYEKFHGKPSTSILEIEEEWHIHKNLAQLGTLVEIKVLLNPTESKTNQRRATLAVPHSDNALKGVQLCSSEGSKRSKTLYLVGGDQSLPLKALGFTAADEKDLMYIGEVEEITYRTRKHFDQFKKIDYYHGLGEVSLFKPQLLYRSRDKKLLIAGGQYDVRPEGIVN